MTNLGGTITVLNIWPGNGQASYKGALFSLITLTNSGEFSLFLNNCNHCPGPRVHFSLTNKNLNMTKHITSMSMKYCKFTLNNIFWNIIHYQVKHYIDDPCTLHRLNWCKWSLINIHGSNNFWIPHLKQSLRQCILNLQYLSLIEEALNLNLQKGLVFLMFHK